MSIDIFDQPDRCAPAPETLAARDDMVPAMTRGRILMASTADRLPHVYRNGAMDSEHLPSRMSNRLHYRDGRIVHMDANQ